MTWNQNTINAAYLKIQNEAATNKEFRTQLLREPNSTIRKIIKDELPTNFNVKIVEHDPSYSATFLLPPMTAGELSINDLENVAGGVLYTEVDPLCGKICGVNFCDC